MLSLPSFAYLSPSTSCYYIFILIIVSYFIFIIPPFFMCYVTSTTFQEWSPFSYRCKLFIFVCREATRLMLLGTAFILSVVALESRVWKKNINLLLHECESHRSFKLSKDFGCCLTGDSGKYLEFLSFIKGLLSLFQIC